MDEKEKLINPTYNILTYSQDISNKKQTHKNEKNENYQNGQSQSKLKLKNQKKLKTLKIIKNLFFP
jgi:hypothetical protein